MCAYTRYILLKTCRIIDGNDFGNGTPGTVSSCISKYAKMSKLTNTAWEDSFVVDVTLNPYHQMLDIGWSGHLRWPFVVLGVLPEVFESVSGQNYYKPAFMDIFTRLWLSSPGKTVESRTLLSTHRAD